MTILTLDRRGAREACALVLAAVLTVVGGTAVGWAATHQHHAPQPRPAAAGSLVPPRQVSVPIASPSISRRPVRPAPLSLRRSRPVEVTIPAIKVTSRLQALGRNSDGAVQVPQPGPLYDEAAWFTGSPTPGQLGASIIEGHVDSKADGPSVFYRLGALTPGDRIWIKEADGQVGVFAVNAVRVYAKDQFPDGLVYGRTSYAALRLITCGGTFDSTTGSYRSNVVVFAYLVGRSRTLPAR